MSFEDRTIKASDVKLHVRLEGQGRAVAVLPGGPGLALDLYHEELSWLASMRRMVSVDYRGCGSSERYSGDFVHRVEDDVADLEDIRRSLKIRRWDIVAHSYGGVVAVSYAAMHHSHLGRLVLVCAPAESADFDAWVERLLASRPQEQVEQLLQLWSRSPASPGVAEAVTVMQFALMFRQIEPGQLQSVLSRLSPIRSLSWEMPAEGLAPMCERIRAETLIVSGAHDCTVPPEHAFILEQHIPNSQIVCFADSAHWPFLEERARFAEVVGSFLTEGGVQ